MALAISFVKIVRNTIIFDELTEANLPGAWQS